MSLATVLAVLLAGWVLAGARPPQPSARRSLPRASAQARASSSASSSVAPEARSRKRNAATSIGSGAFGSAASCAALVGSGQRLARAPGVARFASWNLHWFPDGEPGQRDVGADLTWLACALWWLDADVVAVQEVKQSPHAEQALSAVLTELNRLSGARYRSRLDDCGSRVPQHVGLLWNEARVAASDIATIAALNPHGAACESELRPGLGARFRLPGGLDLMTISAHFKSMDDERGYDLRNRSFAAVPGVLRDVTDESHDADLLLLGDLNTMGCSSCSPAVSAADEVALHAKQLAAGGIRLVQADAAGSELSAGRLTLLDHALASAAMRELPPDARSHVDGVCATGAAPPHGRAEKLMRRSLSDHCPIVLDLVDRDLD